MADFYFDSRNVFYIQQDNFYKNLKEKYHLLIKLWLKISFQDSYKFTFVHFLLESVQKLT